MSEDIEEEQDFECPECNTKFVIESTNAPSGKMKKVMQKAMDRSSMEIWCQICEEFVPVNGEVTDPDFIVEGEDCEECGSHFAMKVETGLSEMYLDIFKKAMEKYDYKLYCQVCEEMKNPKQEVKGAG